MRLKCLLTGTSVVVTDDGDAGFESSRAFRLPDVTRKPLTLFEDRSAFPGPDLMPEAIAPGGAEASVPVFLGSARPADGGTVDLEPESEVAEPSSIGTAGVVE